MEKELFNPMEIDAIGEMMNISLGSSATAFVIFRKIKWF